MMRRLALTALLGLLAAPAGAQNGTPTFDTLGVNGAATIGGQTITGAGSVLSVGGSLGVNGTGPITGFGTAIGQAPQWINFNSSGFPGLNLTSRIILARTTPASNDFADVQINRASAFSGGLATNLNAALRVIGAYGAADATHNYNAAFQATTAGTAGGLVMGSNSAAFRSIGASDGIWGSISVSTDLTGAISSAGRQVIGQEIDVQVNKADDGTNGSAFGGAGIRYGINIAAVRFNLADTVQTEVTSGIWFSTVNITAAVDTHTNFKSAIGFAVNTQTQSALDTRGAIPPAGSSNPVAAVTMTAGHLIDFNGGAALNSAPGDYLAWDSGTSKLKFYVAGVAKWSVDTSGNVRAAGTVTASVTP